MLLYKAMNCQNFTSEDEQALRESLKRCSPETIERAVEFRKTGNAELLGDVVMGIIERFVEEGLREKLRNASDDIVLVDELALDSLTMVEIVLAVEDATGASIENEEVQSLRTLGDVKKFIRNKVESGSA